MTVANSLRSLQNQSGGEIKRGNKFMVPPSILRIQEGFNVRAAFNPEYWDTDEAKQRIASFAHSYTEGKFVPPIVVQVRDGVCYIRDGEHRYRGLMMAINAGVQIQTVDVAETTGDELDELDTLYDSNNGKAWGIIERAIIMQRYSSYGLSNAQIAKRRGVSEATVSNYLTVMQMPLAMKKRIGDGSLSLSVALEQYRNYGSQGMDKPVRSKAIGKFKKQILDIFESPEITEKDGGYYIALSADQYKQVKEYLNLKNNTCNASSDTLK